MLLPSYQSILANLLLLTTCHAGVATPASHSNNPLHPRSLLTSSIAMIPAPKPTSLPPSTPSSRPLRISSAPVNEVPRLVLYFQTTHVKETRPLPDRKSFTSAIGAPISMLPLITEKRIALTHLIVCSFHVHTNGLIHLNDHPPEHPLFYTLWNETAVLKTAGVKVLGMVGGAAAGSFSTQTLDAPLDNSTEFLSAYSILRDTIKRFQLDGMDLDVEQYMTQHGIGRLIRSLRRDFGPDFIITLAPVASALQEGGRGLSGFSYREVKMTLGEQVNFYNAQFYNSWGDMSTVWEYEAIIRQGEWDARKVVAGQITTPDNGGGWVSFERLNRTVRALRSSLGEIGGIAGWEYFNGRPGGEREPWRWAQEMTAILRPGLVRDMKVTRGDAEGLVAAWGESVRGARGEWVNGVYLGGEEVGEEELRPEVDYSGMVNS